jgi:hypothetical protein
VSLLGLGPGASTGVADTWREALKVIATASPVLLLGLGSAGDDCDLLEHLKVCACATNASVALLLTLIPFPLLTSPSTGKRQYCQEDPNRFWIAFLMACLQSKHRWSTLSAISGVGQCFRGAGKQCAITAYANPTFIHSRSPLY